MSDKVWARTHFRRGTKGDRDLRWDSAGSSRVLSVVPGVTTTMTHEIYFWLKPPLWSHLSWSTKECLSECGV